MRNHKVKPKGAMRKDRDYVMFDMRFFLSGMALTVTHLKYASRDVPMVEASRLKLETLLDEVEAALSKQQLDKLEGFRDQVRKFVWDYRDDETMRNQSVMILTFLATLDLYLTAEVKQPT